MKGKIKVVMGTVYPFDESKIKGGVEAVAYYLTKALEGREEIDLSIVSCNNIVKKDFIEKRNNVKFYWIATKKNFYNLRVLTINAFKVREIYKKLNPDIIHVQGISEYSVASRGFPKMILTIHGLESFVDKMKLTSHFSGLQGFYRSVTSKLIADISIKNSCAIVSNAGDYFKIILGEKLNNKRIYYIRNPISKDFIDYNVSDSNQSFVDYDYILWTGTISERKNLIDLIKVFFEVNKCYPNIKLVIIGPVANLDYFNKVKKLINELGLSKVVKYLGHIEQKDLVEYFHHSKLFIFTSIEETAPMSLAQALVCGKPVVATRVGGVPYMIEHNNNGFLFELGDIKSMANKIIEILSDKEYTNNLSKYLKEHFTKIFNPENIALQTVSMYKEIFTAI